MPDLFPNINTYVLCGLIVAGAQLIYATVGFGAGMFSISLMAILLPDLGPTVATLFVLTFVTEVWVLAHAWREAKVWLLLGLLPTAALGMWLGTELLVAGNATGLKRMLGAVVAGAGAWFVYHERRRAIRKTGADPTTRQARSASTRRAWLSVPVGFAAGTLAGLFGTGGPPLIIFLKSHRLDKGPFRATLLWFFLLMSFLRAGTYLNTGLLTKAEVVAALWLLPPSLLGALAGMTLHRHLPEAHFARAVSILFIILGVLLLLGGGK